MSRMNRILVAALLALLPLWLASRAHAGGATMTKAQVCYVNPSGYVWWGWADVTVDSGDSVSHISFIDSNGAEYACNPYFESPTGQSPQKWVGYYSGPGAWGTTSLAMKIYMTSGATYTTNAITNANYAAC